MSAVATGLLIGAGVAKVGSAIAQGVGNRRAAKAMRLTPAQEAELARLKARQARGELGLTSGEEGKIRRQFDAAQDAATRDLQNMQLQQQAAQPQAVIRSPDFPTGAGRAGGAQDSVHDRKASQSSKPRRPRGQTSSGASQNLRGRPQQQRQRSRLPMHHSSQAAFDAAADIGMQGATMAFQSEMHEGCCPQAKHAERLPTVPAYSTSR